MFARLSLAVYTDWGTAPAERPHLWHSLRQTGVVSRIVSKDAYVKYGIGKPDIGKTEFVSLRSDIDDVINSSKGNIDYISIELGIPKEQIEGGLLRLDFKISQKFKPEIPTGNEWGANNQWIPGGKLPTGKYEAVMKTEGMQKEVDYVVIEIGK